MARQRGSRWQADAVIDGKRCRRSFATEAQADSWAAQHQVAAEDKIVAGAETLTTFSKGLQLDLWGGGDNAIRARRNVLEAAEIIGDIAIRDFRTTHVQRLTNEYLKRGLSNGTINRKFATLSRMLHRAVNLELLPRMPVFERKKEPEGRNHYLTRSDEKRLFDALRAISPRSAELAVFLVDTGARLGEAFDLRWSRVDLDEGRITFTQTKTDLTRRIPMTARVKDQLLARRQQEHPFSDVNRYTFRDHWNRARIAAGFKDDPLVVPHILRHTCASRIVQDGHSLFLVGKFLGHKTAAMSNRYSHLAPNTLDRVLETLDRG